MTRKFEEAENGNNQLKYNYTTWVKFNLIHPIDAVQ